MNTSKVKKVLKDRYENERSGEQDLFIDQSKIFQPHYCSSTRSY